ncbi:hypothetical protein MSAN_00781300 [Mycena sanguinolenta]|uniref:Uncharacterized protein n=1 Tax=Mycena sanguinolenta TaxID=230812 RepID=A0A8H7DGJ9_9AGAR|nr:hypothetical protein MSAN_00781300 [Mycena sanguinolenta]
MKLLRIRWDGYVARMTPSRKVMELHIMLVLKRSTTVFAECYKWMEAAKDIRYLAHWTTALLRECRYLRHPPQYNTQAAFSPNPSNLQLQDPIWIIKYMLLSAMAI